MCRGGFGDVPGWVDFEARVSVGAQCSGGVSGLSCGKASGWRRSGEHCMGRPDGGFVVEG